MLTLRLTRQVKPVADSCFGLLTGLPRTLVTVERPWRKNERYVSCIPQGRYFVKWRHAPWSRFPFAYEITKVPGRTGILIHSANLASQLHGCIAPGLTFGTLGGVPAVLSSRVALTYLETTLCCQPFMLEIVHDS